MKHSTCIGARLEEPSFLIRQRICVPTTVTKDRDLSTEPNPKEKISRGAKKKER
jgi:hypothetical protein